MKVVYSYDMNVLRANPRQGRTVCIPFTIGGRRLKPSELIKVAQKNFGRVNDFRYLKQGEGWGLEGPT